MSPTGATFRNQVKAFPSLVNCTTMDWFHPWPEDALEGVAQFQLKDMEVDAKVKRGMIDILVDMQTRIRNLTYDQIAKHKRQQQVTPSSQLDLIKN